VLWSRYEPVPILPDPDNAFVVYETVGHWWATELLFENFVLQLKPDFQAVTRGIAIQVRNFDEEYDSLAVRWQDEVITPVHHELIPLIYEINPATRDELEVKWDVIGINITVDGLLVVDIDNPENHSWG
jgi:hypothetical protein